MGTGSVYIFLLIGISISIVKSKNPFFDYYYNKYHKGASTTGSTASTSEFGTTELEYSSSQDISTTAEELPLTSLGDYVADKTTSVEDKNQTSLEANSTIIQNGDSYDDSTRIAFLVRVGIGFGSLLFLFLCLGGIMRCCPTCHLRKERMGFVVANNARERGNEVHPQPVITQPALPAPVIQHFPPEFSQEPMQQFPPQYQHQPLQPQPQYSTVQPGYQYAPIPQPHYSPVQQGYQHPSAALQFYNPPEAPPPYEDTLPNKS